MHGFRGLVLGAYLNATSLIGESERRIAEITPEWSIFDDRSNSNPITPKT